MTIDTLKAYAEALPAGSVVLVPRETLLQLVNPASGVESQPITQEADLTVEDLASLIKRSPARIRALLGAGMFEGAYRLAGTGAWRIPHAAVEAFRQHSRNKRTRTTPVSFTPATNDLKISPRKKLRGN